MSQRAKVVITDFVTDLTIEREHLADIADVESADARSEDELAGRVEDAAALMLYHSLSLTAQTIDRLKNCQLIIRCGVGFDNVDFQRARSRGIPVANIPDYGTEDVADSAIGMMLALTRGIHLLNSRLRGSEGPWSYTQAAPLQRLRDRVFGIVGLGRIGTAAAVRARALGMHVVFYDPYKPDGYDKALGITRAETLTELLSRSHAVSLHCPLTSETHHMIDRAALAQMVPRSFLINTARGGVVDTDAIPAAIASWQLAGAAIDVLEGEPPANDNVLVKAWRDPANPCHHRVILNPHAAFYSEQGHIDMRVKGSIACRKAILGQQIPNVVN